MKWLVVKGQHAWEVEADTPVQAVMETASVNASVHDMVVGATFRVYPADFCETVLMQYEDPNADGDMGRWPDYGRSRVVEKFQPVARQGVFG